MRSGRRNGKYNAKPTVVDGIRFDSKREAGEWVKLSALFKRGRIHNLTRQRTYDLVVNGVKVATYRSDFEWDEYTHHQAGLDSQAFRRHVVADVKGVRTRDYVMKRKLMKACHDIDILEL